eukprot:1265654-Alexandrium_andersonii.AAC.1
MERAIWAVGRAGTPTPKLDCGCRGRDRTVLRVKVAMALNNSFAEIEKGLNSPMDEAAAPNRPAAQNALVPRPESVKSTTLSVAALGAGRVARSAAPPARSAQTLGSPTSADVR